MKRVAIRPCGVDLRADSRRVVVRPFLPVDARLVASMLERALALDEAGVARELGRVREHFSGRHHDLDCMWLRHFEQVRHVIPPNASVSRERCLWIGSLFSGEYALESAALFNPSLVPHPDQGGLAAGELRVIMSLRATGEGHISSIEFRAGILGADHTIQLEPAAPFVTLPRVNPNPRYHKATFRHKLEEMGLNNEWAREVMGRLPDTFTLEDLDASRGCPDADGLARESHEVRRTRECMHWLAESNYEIHFDAATSVSERIIFPVSPNESNGIEDARFVRFIEQDGTATYYATYTAYNGRVILPQLMTTPDFRNFRILTLNGPAVHNKGMALFPRRVGGRYAMLSRQDDENLFLMWSDHPHFWSGPCLLQRPVEPWESVKIGNCGSPIETDAGWLVITHGVGPMRRYCLGALLLDLDDPSRVIGRLKEPLLEPEGEAREGYVPNVVYSCGALLHRGRVVIPCGLSDSATTVVSCDWNELRSALTS